MLLTTATISDVLGRAAIVEFRPFETSWTARDAGRVVSEDPGEVVRDEGPAIEAGWHRFAER
jgi:hypothetical protein